MYRVLVADGEFVTREALCVMVGKVDGFEVAHTAGDGEKAVELCCSLPLDLAFLATVLPRLSGLEAAKRIHERVPALPLVLVAATDSAAFAKEALHYNRGGYVTKPVSFAAVRDILLAHKARHAFESLPLADALRDVVAARDFARAYESIPAFAQDILSRAGASAKGRRELLERAGGRLAGLLEEFGKERDPLPLFDERLLVPAGGVALNLFEMLDAVFRRNCVAAYPVLAPAFSFIDTAINEKIGLEEIVASAAASQTHVSRIFKKYFNISVMDYLHLRKLHIAKTLFTYTRQGVAEAAFALGYSEAGYFSKVFKKFEGMTVQQYKASVQAL